MSVLADLNVFPETIADFCRRWSIREFAVFDSAARGELRPDSDVDVMVEFQAGPRPRGFKYMDPIQRAGHGYRVVTEVVRQIANEDVPELLSPLARTESPPEMEC